MLDRAAIRLSTALIVLALIAGTPMTHARGQEFQQGIAAVVNEDIVSIFDVVQRVRLIIFSAGLPDTPATVDRIAPQVLQTLIDERLRLQEAERYNVTVDDQEIDEAVAQIEERNGIPPNGFEALMRSQGIDPETVVSQIRAQLGWQRLVGQRMRSSIVVGDDEIDEAIEQFKSSQGVTEFLISEIFLPMGSSETEDAAYGNALQIVEQVRDGIEFAELARQFSSSVTASQGGKVGWVLREQMPDEVGAAIDSLPRGSVSDPIRAGGGFLIVYLHERRLRTVGDPGDVRVELKQILYPLADGASDAVVQARISDANALRARLTSCTQMDALATELDPSMSGDLGVLHVKDLPQQMRAAIEGLDIGDASAPVVTSAGVHLFMVCDRIEPTAGPLDRDAVRESLINKRFEQASRRYLRDIRRNAFVEVRI